MNMLIRKGFKFRLKIDRFIESALVKAAGGDRWIAPAIERSEFDHASNKE